MYVAPLGYYRSDVFPISSIDSKIVNKDVVSKWFEEEFKTFRASSDRARSYGINWKESSETLKYERVLTDGSGSKIGALTFEIIEESKFRENRTFLSPTA